MIRIHRKTCQRDNKLTHNTCEIAGVQLPKNKVCDCPRSAGVNRAEMHGVTINNISRMSKHDTNDKLNSSYMTQAPENTMHGNSGHFVHPDFEPYFLPMSLMPVPEWMKNKAFHKLPICREQCKTKEGDKTLSAVNFLLLTAPRVEISLFQGCKF